MPEGTSTSNNFVTSTSAMQQGMPMQQPVMAQSSMPKTKKPKNLLPVVIILAILTVAGVGVSIFSFMQSSAKDTEIADLKAQLSQNGDTPSPSSSQSSGGDDGGSGEDAAPKNVYLLSDELSFTEQRYRIAVDPKDPQSYTELASDKDKFYLLDMDELNTGKSLVTFDLAGILKPTIDNTIATELPDSSTNALGSVTQRAQCNSFDVFYTDPVSDDNQRPLFMPMNEFNQEVDVPVTVNYFCHTNDYDVVFLKATYIINTENHDIQTYSTNSDFSNQN